jgi:hypothetical protein
MKLNQVIAIEKGTKSRSLQDLTEAHHTLQKPALLAGIARTYRPKDEEGEQFPPESTRVQVKAEDVIRKTSEVLTKLFDVVATELAPLLTLLANSWDMSCLSLLGWKG